MGVASICDWRPTASLAELHRRARLLAQIRRFFAEREVLEVDTPVLSARGNPDPQIDGVHAELRAPGPGLPASWLLHTSPEFAMKRLLAAGAPSIYQVCKVFRDGEAGRWHNPEFTMLEWYRLGWDHWRLMAEVAELVAGVLTPAVPEPTVEYWSYREVFQRGAGIDPFAAGVDELAECAREAGLHVDGLTRDAWLDLLLSQVVVAGLDARTITFVYGYPPSQAALARLDADGLAERFECFVGPVELANGYSELADAEEQRLRFERHNEARAVQRREAVPWDERLIAALEHGMPACAGVALGVERLHMLVAGTNHIDDVLSFPAARA